MSDETLVERLRDLQNDDCAYVNQCGLARAVGVEHCITKHDYGCNACLNETIQAIADTIEREYLPRPRFEDGEPVQFGDKFESAGTVGTVDYILKGNVEGCVIGRKEDSGCVTYPNGKRVKRPEPEVLDADGVPIHKGDTVYDIASGYEMVVMGVHPYKCDGEQVEFDGDEGDISRWFSGCHFTHKQPDSLARIEEDVPMSSVDYRVKDGYENMDVRELAISILLEFKTSLSTESEYRFDSVDDAETVFYRIMDILDAADCYTIDAFCDDYGSLYLYTTTANDRVLSL